LHESQSVLTTHLLRQHHSKGGKGSSSNTGNGEKLNEALGVVGLLQDLVLNLQLRMNVENVSGHLKITVSKAPHRLPCFWVTVFLHVPTRRLGAKVDEQQQRNGREEGGTWNPILQVSNSSSGKERERDR